MNNFGLILFNKKTSLLIRVKHDSRIDKLKAKISGTQGQIEALTEHLSRVPKDVSPLPIFAQMKKIENMKGQMQAELEELLVKSKPADIPAAFQDFESFVKAAQKLNETLRSQEVRAKIVKKLVHKVEFKPGGFRLHYFVGKNEIANSEWEINQELEQSQLQATGSDGGKGLTLSPVPALNPNKNFFNISGSKRLTNGGPDRDRTDDLLHAMQALSQLSYRPL